MRLFIVTVVVAIGFLVVSGCALTRGTSTKGLEVPIERAAVQFAADLAEGRYRTVTTAELKQWFDERRDIILISTLPLFGERELGGIPGALSAAMPFSATELAPEDREHLLTAAGSNKDRTVVVYSAFVADRRSHFGARMLVDNGYRNVYRYPAGITGWTEAGYPVAK